MKNTLPPHSGHFDMNNLSDSTRKRKSTTDQHITVSEYGFLRELDLMNDQVNSLPQSIDLDSLWHQFEKDEVKKINKSCLGMLPQSFHHEGPSPLNEMLVDETVNVSYPLSQMNNILSQTKPLQMKSFSVCVEKPQADIGQDIITSGLRNHEFADKLLLERHRSPSESLGPLKISHRSNIGLNGHWGNSHVKSCPREANRSNTLTINDVLGVGENLSGTSTCIEQTKNNRLSKSEVQSGSGSLTTGFRDNVQVNAEGHGDVNVLILKEIEGADTNKARHLLEGKISHMNGDCANVVKDGKRNKIKVGSLQSPDDKSTSQTGKLAPIVAEKLWDGSLQLNNSVTVSAIASFKSGEKMHDCKWPDFIEVKGKVRLEAFEKYIQDLPRSCNRGLMVISLHCKEGSSKSELAGMKEVAKGYKKGKRVGFAQISEGIDLYVCPRSDTIITVLAKHGFFKGMSAVEDNRDSLIGCVVWRRNRASVNSVVKKSERKNHSLAEQPLNSLSDSSSHRADEKDLPGKQPAQESIQVESRTDCKILGTAGNYNVESKNIETSKIHPERHNNYCTSASLSIKEPVPIPDDDDLPEFDFGAACGKVLDTAMVEKKLPAEFFLRINGQLMPMIPNIQSMPASNRREMKDFGLGRLPLNTFQRMPMQNKVSEYDYKTLSPVSTKPKNLFDDDDMPEWCPPYVKLERQMVSETPRPSTGGGTSTNPHFFTQKFTDRFNCPMDPNVKPALPKLCNVDILRKSSNSLMGFNSNPLFRPSINPLDVKVPVHPDHRSRRRP